MTKNGKLLTPEDREYMKKQRAVMAKQNARMPGRRISFTRHVPWGSYPLQYRQLQHLQHVSSLVHLVEKKGANAYIKDKLREAVKLLREVT